MLIGGRSVEDGAAIDVLNPYDGSVVGSVPSAEPRHVEAALSAAREGAAEMSAMSRALRAEILDRVARDFERSDGVLARTIALESGKTLREASAEVGRAAETFRTAADEARRLAGEIVPFDAAPNGGSRFGFYIRIPLGIVVAVTPFNFPLNLAAHKVAPALAAGNAVILKPASATPLTAIALCKALYAAGLPPSALSVVTGPGGSVGSQLVGDSRPRMVTFTGSRDVGAAIAAAAGLKKTTFELGSNAAVIVTENCDVDEAAVRCVRGSCALAGQVCISVQRVLVIRSELRAFEDAAAAEAERLRVGDQLSPDTDVGPMIDEAQAARAESWLDEARRLGARVLSGGSRRGTLFEPTVLTGVPDGARLWKDEAFAPIMVIRPYDTFDEALAQVNASIYGLQAGVFTDRIEDALRAAREIACGGVMVNDVPTFRADLMPYGGQKGSGFGREGPRFAVEEMSETRVVAFRRREGASGFWP